MPDAHAPAGPLSGIRVIDVATMIAGPTVAQLLGDFGAEVIKVEHPRRGDPLRTHGVRIDEDSAWWKQVGRNKRCIGIDLGEPDGAELLRRLTERSDVLIEGFRPGTLERYGLAPSTLQAANPRLIVLRMSGFGQTGPYVQRPAFGTLIEAMSGFAHATGEADGPPTLPPFGLADSIAGVSGFAAVLTALYDRDARGGVGQVIDVSILEAMIATLGPASVSYDRLGIVPRRSGNRSTNNAPRNTYLTKDSRWFAVSASATPVAARLMRLVGHPEVVEESWFEEGSGRAEHADLLDGYVQQWIGRHTLDEVVAAFEREGVAGAPVLDIAGLMADPHVKSREAFVAVPDDDGRPVAMPNLLFRLDRTPGGVRHPGRTRGADTEAILTGLLGMTPSQVAQLRERGIVA